MSGQSTDPATTQLNVVYRTFVGKAEAMDSRSWVKLLKETKLIDKGLTTTDADLIFAKLKSGKTLGFTQFLEALKQVATRKKVPYEDVVAQVSATEGPTFTGTKAEPTRFHDDKSLYTGVHAHGGPSTVDTKKSPLLEGCAPDLHDTSGRIVRLDDLLDRSEPTVRGINKGM